MTCMSISPAPFGSDDRLKMHESFTGDGSVASFGGVPTGPTMLPALSQFGTVMKVAKYGAA